MESAKKEKRESCGAQKKEWVIHFYFCNFCTSPLKELCSNQPSQHGIIWPSTSTRLIWIKGTILEWMQSAQIWECMKWENWNGGGTRDVNLKCFNLQRNTNSTSYESIHMLLLHKIRYTKFNKQMTKNTLHAKNDLQNLKCLNLKRIKFDIF